jgi:hypothetical protein
LQDRCRHRVAATGAPPASSQDICGASEARRQSEAMVLEGASWVENKEARKPTRHRKHEPPTGRHPAGNKSMREIEAAHWKTKKREITTQDIRWDYKHTNNKKSMPEVKVAGKQHFLNRPLAFAFKNRPGISWEEFESKKVRRRSREKYWHGVWAGLARDSKRKTPRRASRQNDKHTHTHSHTSTQAQRQAHGQTSTHEHTSRQAAEKTQRRSNRHQPDRDTRTHDVQIDQQLHPRRPP